jgi:hypothetical protein
LYGAYFYGYTIAADYSGLLQMIKLVCDSTAKGLGSVIEDMSKVDASNQSYFISRPGD